MSEITPLPIERDENGVATLTLEQPGRPVVVLDRALIGRLDAALDTLTGDEKGLVLASGSERVFVAGADLKEIRGLSDEELDAYLGEGQRVFGRLAALPCKTVAAVNGAALGGGLEVALHCDELVGILPGEGEKPYMVGLPEASLGLCPGWGGTNTLAARIEPGRAIRMAAGGKPMPAREAHEAGLFAGIATDRETLMAVARERAAGAKPAGPGDEPRNISQSDIAGSVRDALERVSAELPNTKAAAAVVEAARTGLERGWSAALDAERRLLIGLRKTDEAERALEAFFARGKK